MTMPFIVSGTITDSDGNNPSGVKVVARNDRTIENISVNTNASGQYVMDLANLTSGWSAGDSVSIIVRDGLEEGDSSFTVSGSAQTVDITMSEILDSADVAYCTITEVYNELDGKTTSDISAERVRNAILRSEAEIDARTGTSFKSNTVSNEVYDITLENLYLSPNSTFNVGLARSDGGVLPGTRTPLNRRPILSVTSLSKNGAGATEVDSWTALTEHTGAVAGNFSVYKRKGIVEWLSSAPNAQRRSFKVSYTWGLDRDSTGSEDLRKMELVRQLAVLMSVRQILATKGSGSQFDSTDSISLESISISKGIGDTAGYLTHLDERINKLFEALGTTTVWGYGNRESGY